MKKSYTILMLAALFALSGCAQMDQTAETNKTAAERFTNEVWNGGNLDAVDELVAVDFVRHNPASWMTPKIEGAEAFKTYITNVRTTYPDFHVEIHSRITDGDMVAAAWTVSGTNSELNKKISVMGMTMTRFVDGKASEEWVAWDTKGMEQQLAMDSEDDTTMK